MRAYLILLLTLLSTCVYGNNFPTPASLEPAVRFWTRVYTDVTTHQGYVHDAVDLAVIYETLSLPPHASQAERKRIVDSHKHDVERALASLAAGKRSGLSAVEARVLAAWPKGTSSARLREAAGNVRFQLGQSDRFREGLIRSGQWRPHIRAVLTQHNLPQELEVLPHVESSFNPSAYSKVAAAGMWQFMPATARQYMRVDDILDERMDPYIATEGAARLLKHNYAATGSWPLALTAYNHGASGMQRAVKTLGTRDMGVIVHNYKGPAFGFASRNFYASFLAALHVDRNAAKYFGKVTMASPLDYDIVRAPDYIPVAALAQSSGVSIDELKVYNPALRERVWNGEKYIPRGYTVRIPKSNLRTPLQTIIASLSSDQRFSHQKSDVVHRIARGESLSTIAGRYNTSVATLMALNGLSNANRIRAGQNLRLPGNAQTAALAAAASTRTAAPASRGAAATYVVRSGDSLWIIARKFGVSQQQLLAWNRIGNKNHIRPGQTLKISGAGGNAMAATNRHYVIQPGDSLWSIARRFNLSQQDILAWNNLQKGQVIKPGQTLRLASN
ncbi:MAG: LysM peptidoglycan-binding domain-containing protein [Porticoccaceae bacterium]